MAWLLAEGVPAERILLLTFTRRAAREMGVLDLDDLLLYWRALVSDEVVGPLIADEFDHVLVDEYQDVNGLQVDIVVGMRSTCPPSDPLRRAIPRTWPTIWPTKRFWPLGGHFAHI